MGKIIEEHTNTLGVEPEIIGMFWDDPAKIEYGIREAIRTGKPYDEYAMLSKEDQQSFDAGALFF